ncbi:hypothetical protein CRI94_11830 [Longibacter salinarum]|uniref:DUF4382 domain-containing protein n=1 Tax=Longibacter salinarum TaxID=1850348 RepID=A0A2A8CVT2_9BACT|nr:hypothetical protein [Longibacter salinarum]PEN12711.1 hypothetical protein CRI94_11830 [Longibacter salinarum]
MTILTRLLGPLLFATLVAGGALVGAGCDGQGGGMQERDRQEDDPAAVSYELKAQPNDGAFPLGRSGQVTFYDLGGDSTLVTLDLAASLNRRPEPGPPQVSFATSIRRGRVSRGGERIYRLSPIDARTTALESARLVMEPIDAFLNLDGHVQIRERIADTTVISQGNIGTNADGVTRDAGLELVTDPRTLVLDLHAVPNEGRAVPDGRAGTVRFRELTHGKTLVTVALDPAPSSGSTGADVAHPVYIRGKSASGGVDITLALSPISGMDPAARSSRIIRKRFEVFTDIDGHVTVHESNANRSIILARGNIEATASPSGNDGSENDGPMQDE